MSTSTPEPVEDDDSALSWEGDEARGQAAPRLRGDTPAPASRDAGEEWPVRQPRTPRETGLLVATVLFAVLFLAESIGWITAVQVLGYPGGDLLGEVMWQFGEFLAMVSPILWFAAVVSLTPPESTHRLAGRVAGFLLGTLVLIPWPAVFYLMGSAQ